VGFDLQENLLAININEETVVFHRDDLYDVFSAVIQIPFEFGRVSLIEENACSETGYSRTAF